jgi:hypothetical protein
MLHPALKRTGLTRPRTPDVRNVSRLNPGKSEYIGRKVAGWWPGCGKKAYRKSFETFFYSAEDGSMGWRSQMSVRGADYGRGRVQITDIWVETRT